MDRTIGAALLGASILAGCTEVIEVPVFVPIPVPLQPSCVPVPPGALHWWPGDGTGADLVGDHDASLMNGATYTQGIVTSGGGQAFSFDGLDAIAQVPHAGSLSPTGAFSVMAWARPGAIPTFNGAIVGKGTPWDEAWVIDHHAGVWRGVVRDVSRIDQRIHGPAIVPGQWAHLSLTWDAQTLRFYVDAELQGTRPITTINQSTAYVGIGARSEEGYRDSELDLEFAGDVEEVAFFGRALGPAEIDAVYEAGHLGMCKP